MQYILDSEGKKAGVYLPISEWEKVLAQLRRISGSDNKLPEWQQNILDERLNLISEENETYFHLFETLDELEDQL
jgi:hypothetical protein